MDERFDKRIAKIRDALGPARIEGLWVEPSLDLTYLTGLQPISLERIMGLLVRPAGNLRMVVPEILAEESEGVPGCEIFTWNDSEGPTAALVGAFADVAALHVSPNLPIGVARQMQAARPGLAVEVDDSIIASARAVKDESEMEALRRAGRITDGTVEWVASLDLTGLTEGQLAQRISQHYTESGHRPWDVLLVASGANAAMGHYHGDVAIDRSVPLLIDIGAAVDGYQSDTTRVLFPETIPAEVEDAYGAVLDAYQAALYTVAPGVPAQEVDRAARRVITQAGYGERFNHRTGHGVGLDIHEHPYIREGNAEPLQVGNCFSIEPGIYVPGRFGLRYENLVLLTSDGPEPLNRTPERMSLY